MEKRFLLAILLSTLVLASWSYLFPPPEPAPNELSAQPAVSDTTTQPATNAASDQPSATGDQPSTTSHQPPPTPSPDTLAQAPARQIRVQTPYWRITFSSRGAVPISWTIKKNHAGPRKEIRGDDGKELELIPQSREILDQLGVPLALVTTEEQLNNILKTANYAVSAESETIELAESESRELVFSLESDDIQVHKTFVFHGDRFDFEYTVDAQRGGQPFDVQTILGPNFGDQSVKETGAYIAGPHVVADVADKVQRIQAGSSPPQQLTGPVNWVSVDDNYFALVLIPREPLSQVQLREATHTANIHGSEIQKHFIAALAPTPQGQQIKVFAGPKDPELLVDLGKQIGKPSIEHLINYGYMSVIIKPIVDGVLLPVLLFSYKFIPNYGVVIMLITFFINMLFFPLKWKGSVKMKKAQAMQPKMKELQQKMKGLKKDDPQMKELQMEQIQLMKEANPLGGCLPTLVQLPVFWAFFVLLTVSIDVRQAPFVGWIDNLTAPDRLPLFGLEIHVLPILMCLTWMASTFVMPMPGAAPADPTQATQQKLQKVLMGVVMPVAMTIFFFWKAPSGLVLYWLFNNMVVTGQQLVINRLTPAPAPEVSPGAGPAKKGKPAAKPTTTT